MEGVSKGSAQNTTSSGMRLGVTGDASTGCLIWTCHQIWLSSCDIASLLVTNYSPRDSHAGFVSDPRMVSFCCSSLGCGDFQYRHEG